MAITLSGGVASATAEETVPLFDKPLSKADVVDSMHYLMSEYGVTESEAMRRLELQRAAPVLAERLSSQEPDSYAGMWIDQAGGGKLVVAMTRPERLNAVVATVPDRQNIRAQRVARSLKTLNAIQDRLIERVGRPGPDALDMPSVDEKANKVVLYRRDWLPGARDAGRKAAADKAVQGALREFGNAVVTAKTEQPSPLQGEAEDLVGVQSSPPYEDWGYCHPLHCSNYGPMRGGLRLDIQRSDDYSWGGCTSGFNITSYWGSYHYWRWIVTAGHCVLGSRHTWTDYSYHNGVAVGKEMYGNSDFNNGSYPFDFAMMPYLTSYVADRWIDNHPVKNKVLSTCRYKQYDNAPGTSCERDGDFHITGYYSADSIGDGWVVCASGAGSSPPTYTSAYDTKAGAGYWPGTRCGQIMSSSRSNGIYANICARRGDSGGPLFSQIDAKAYGILTGNIPGQQFSGPCTSGEYNNYTPVSNVLDWVHSSTDSNFTVNTFSTS